MFKIIPAIALLVLLCSSANAGQTAALVVYQVHEPGLDPYLSRYLVTPAYLRLDEGEKGPAGYTLLDRRKKIIYNVSPEDQSILVMDPPEAVPPTPRGLRIRETVEVDEEAPLVAGKRPSNVKLIANEATCTDLVVVGGVMPEAVQAMKELRQVLARIQWTVLAGLPEDTTSACDLAELIYAPTAGLTHGLPIQERTSTGSQSMLDFNPAFEVSGDLFHLPEGYRRMPMPGLAPE